MIVNTIHVGKNVGIVWLRGEKQMGLLIVRVSIKDIYFVRFINLFRLCTKYISRFYVSFRLEPISEPMIEPIWVLKYTIVTIEEGIYEFRKRK